MVKLEDISLVSIGIPFHNAERYLSYAILSVLNQTYKEWELILIDDGSTDNSLKIANEYSEKDSRIRVISDSENKKLPARLNQLIVESKGSYIARMDADDIMHPERLDKQLCFLESNKNYDLVSTGLISIDNFNIVKGFRGVSHIYNEFSTIKLGYPIVHPSVIARKAWYERNEYSESYPRAEDFELWTRSIVNSDFKMAVIPDLLLFYREEGNLCIDKIINSYNDTLRIYDKYHSKNSFNINVLKLKLKLLIAKTLHFSGNLQKLASRRNTTFTQKELIDFQVVLDNITNVD
ncbi:glycosyltransferase involved in cell wall biosynthesis [Psychrobacter sp. PL15]|uniref:glycosyltransferase family 2 protein n=1 Tax=Psychrobacter sp. PL15 TaxID=3071719 RepID=UPI002DFB71C7|nr:glycosyltransferase involved in cell wall biosynthesis [Psychrobacter sp. PL15]